MELNANIPSGPIDKKWEKHRFDMKLVNPANKRKYNVIVVGTGLAGGAAAATLAELGYANIEVSSGDGYRGIPSEAPFDGILVTAAPDEIPEPLIEQLAVGGRMVIPVGDFYQQLTVVEKTEKGISKRTVFPVRFVPMTGEATR